MNDLIESGSFIEEECWLRQPGETGAAFAAFCQYRDYGGDRSIRKVMESGEIPKGKSGLWMAWSKRYAWVLRAEKYDCHLDKVRLSENEKLLREREAQHLKLSARMLELVERKLEKMDPEELSQGQILDWMKDCSRLEREILKTDEKDGPVKQLEISFFDDFKGV